jgi:hypothetical protein
VVIRGTPKTLAFPEGAFAASKICGCARHHPRAKVGKQGMRSLNRQRNAMKLKSIVISALLLTGLAAGNANAAYCSLSVSHAYVPLGQDFTYGITIDDSLPGPLPPSWYRPFTVVFYGFKNGVADIPASGETYPAQFPYYNSTLTGYNNIGGLTGQYIRYAVILQNGQVACVTNPVNVTLQ